MYSCLRCGAWLWRKNIYCNLCDIYLVRPQRRKIKQHDHYYFYDWNVRSQELIHNLKNGHHKRWLQQKKQSLISYRKVVTMDHNIPVFVAPSSSQKRGQHNHAYLLASSMGFLNIHDIFIRSKSQRQQNLAERRSNQLQMIQPICFDYNEIVIVDDVVTTGNTVQSILDLLKPQKANIFSLAYVKKRFG